MLKYAMLFSMLITGTIFAQYYSKVSANIKARLIKGTTISVIDQRLQPERSSKVMHPQLIENNSDDILVHITGGDIKNIMVNYLFVNHPQFYSIKEIGSEKVKRVHSTFDYNNGKDLYILIDEPVPDVVFGKINNNNKICYVSLAYN